MLTSRHAISSSMSMLYVLLFVCPSACPSVCVQLSGLRASGSLLHPSLTCRVWEVLWFEQPPPPPSISLSLSPHFLTPHLRPSTKASSAQTLVGASPWNVPLQGCMRNTRPSQFPFTYSTDLEQFNASSENYQEPFTYLQTEVIVATSEGCTMSRWKVETLQWGHKMI